MSDTFIPPSADLDSVDHTDDEPGTAGVDVSPAPAAPGPVDERSDAEQALAPAPVDDAGPIEPATADDAVAPDKGDTPPATVTTDAPGVTSAPPIGDVDQGDLLSVLRALIGLLDDVSGKVDQLDGKVDGLVTDIGDAKAALAEFQEKAPSMLGGLSALFGNKG